MKQSNVYPFSEPTATKQRGKFSSKVKWQTLSRHNRVVGAVSWHNAVIPMLASSIITLHCLLPTIV